MPVFVFQSSLEDLRRTHTFLSTRLRVDCFHLQTANHRKVRVKLLIVITAPIFGRRFDGVTVVTVKWWTLQGYSSLRN